jgi:hypothetical protein
MRQARQDRSDAIRIAAQNILLNGQDKAFTLSSPANLVSTTNRFIGSTGAGRFAVFSFRANHFLTSPADNCLISNY